MSVIKRWILVHSRAIDGDTWVCLCMWMSCGIWEKPGLPVAGFFPFFRWIFKAYNLTFSSFSHTLFRKKKKTSATNKALISRIRIFMFIILIRSSDFWWLVKTINWMLTAFILYGVFLYHCYPAGSTAYEDPHRELDIWDSASLFVSFSKICKLACQV